MEKYAEVHFGSDESYDQRDFLIAMNGIGIIEITQDEIDECCKEMAYLRIAQDNHLVLHDDEEVQRFENIMHTFFPKRAYKITNTPGNKEFEDWLRR